MHQTPRKQSVTRRWCLHCGRESNKGGRCEACGISLVSLVNDDGLPKLRALSESLRLERETALRNAAIVLGVTLGFFVGFAAVVWVPLFSNWSLLVPMVTAIVGAMVCANVMPKWQKWRASRSIARRPNDGGSLRP